MSKLRILFLGDIVGPTGCAIFQRHIQRIRSDYKVDAVIVNGENSDTKGRGISPQVAQFFKEHGVDVITSGNHIWQNKEIYDYLSKHTDLLRPANYPAGAPGVGVTTFNCKGFVIGVVNLQGRVFMREHVNCPFREIESILTYLRSRTSIILIDFHAEASSEKQGLAYFVDGRVSAIVGTHTHVQTADERIMPGGTAYITDLGYAGSLNSMLGMKKESIINHFLTQLPVKFTVEATNPVVMHGVIIDVDTDTGKALHIERIRIEDSNVQL